MRFAFFTLAAAVSMLGLVAADSLEARTGGGGGGGGGGGWGGGGGGGHGGGDGGHGGGGGGGGGHGGGDGGWGGGGGGGGGGHGGGGGGHGGGDGGWGGGGGGGGGGHGGGGGGNQCSKHCNFPAHSVPQCTKQDPCAFACTDGYTAHPSRDPTSCVCKYPLTDCNGVCGYFKGCPSKGHHKRDIPAEKTFCPSGETACGVFGRQVGSWECINTNRDLESCGGCMVSIFGDINDRQGRDCTAIHGVDDVSCVSGRCEVRKCYAGYEVNAAGDSCTPVDRAKSIFKIAEEVLVAQLGA